MGKNATLAKPGQKAAEKGKLELSAAPLDAAADGLGCVGRLVGQREGAAKGVTWRKKSSEGRKVRLSTSTT